MDLKLSGQPAGWLEKGMYKYLSARFMSASGLRLIAAAGLGMVLASPTDAAVTFSFNFLDSPGVGFNASGSTGADRRAGLAQAGDYLAGLFVNYNATIELDVTGSETDDFVLASAGSNYNGDVLGNGFGDIGDVMLKILGGDGADPSPGTADGEVFWNFQDFSWEPLSDFQAGELDLIATAIHELTHTIGFVSSIFEDGSSYFDPAGVASAWSPFDRYVADYSGSLINDTTFVLDTARWATASVGGAGPISGLLFNGPNAMAANGGNAVPLYSPTSWEEGSSGSHTDTGYFTGPNEQLMNSESSVYEGLEVRTLSSIEMGILQDIGYTQIVLGLTGDLDGDGFVGIADLNIVLANWNTLVTAGDLLSGDPSGDSFVGIEDLNTVLGNWNAGTPPQDAQATVPEPATLSLLTAALIGVLTVRRRGAPQPS
jgi:PEP-CTERM motif